MNKNEPRGDLMATAAPFDLQRQGIIGIRGIAPDDPRYVENAGMTAEYAVCSSCGYLLEGFARPPKFCPECGSPFVPARPDRKEEVR